MSIPQRKYGHRILTLVVTVAIGLGFAGPLRAAPAKVKAVDDSPLPGSERFIFGFGPGIDLPSTVSGASYSVSPAIELNFEFKLLPWIGIGASSFTDLLLPSTTGAPYVFEGALLPQLVFYIGDTGLYAGIRAGVSDFDTFVNSTTALYWVFVWGPKAGYRYQFPNSHFSLGPEFSWLFVSSGTSTDSAGNSVSLPSHQDISFFITANWSL